MEAIFQQLEMHMTFICPECGESFELQQQWRQHLNFHHDYLCKTPEDFGFAEINERYHECLECNQLVADGKRAIALLQYHRFVHLPYKCTYKCRHCFGTFMRKRICFNHLCRVHENIVGKKLAAAAIKTPMLANRKDSLGKMPTSSSNSSIARHNPEFYMRCICPQCGYEVNKTEDWLRHIETAHRQTLHPHNALQQIAGTEDFICSICNKILYTGDREKHQRHYFSHLPYKLNFRCAYCKIRRSFKTEVLHHFMTTHLLVFERQRIYMRKPKEFGHDINRKLDRELDLLLKYGNSVSAQKGGALPKLPAASQERRNPTTVASKVTTVNNDVTKTENTSSFSDLESKPKGNVNRTTNIKKELDALCAEIFKDIEDDEIVTENVIEAAITGSMTEPNSFMQCNMDNLVKSQHNSSSNNETNNIVEEEVVCIEIDTLDEYEINQIDENDDTTHSLNDASTNESRKLDLYENLKALYNAKVLHLCPQCGIAFTEQSIWRDHVLKTHEILNNGVEENYRLLENQSNLCLTCNTVLHTTVRTDLQRHRFTHMPYNAYLKCTLCEKCETSKPHMLNHLEKNHGNFLKSLDEYGKKMPQPQQVKTEESYNNAERFTKAATNLQTDTDKSDYIPLLTHLKKARKRLNRMAAQYGIENK